MEIQIVSQTALQMVNQMVNHMEKQMETYIVLMMASKLVMEKVLT